MWAKVAHSSEQGVSVYINFALVRDIHASDGGAALTYDGGGPVLRLNREQWQAARRQLAGQHWAFEPGN